MARTEPQFEQVCHMKNGASKWGQEQRSMRKAAAKTSWWSDTEGFTSSVSERLMWGLLRWGFSSFSRQRLKWEKELGIIRQDLNSRARRDICSLSETPHIFSLGGRNFRVGCNSPQKVTLFWGTSPDCKEAEWFEKAWMRYAVLGGQYLFYLYIKRDCILEEFSWAI